MQQHTIVYRARVAELQAEAAAHRLAQEAERAAEAQSLADRVAERARRWAKAA